MYFCCFALYIEKSVDLLAECICSVIPINMSLQLQGSILQQEQKQRGRIKQGEVYKGGNGFSRMRNN